jgi:hypothetical protein
MIINAGLETLHARSLPEIDTEVKMKKTINRTDFLNTMIRIVMASLLTLVAVLLGKKISTGTDCRNCPGKGICRGEPDCSKFLAETR